MEITPSSSPFAVIYRGYIKPGTEKLYIESWKKIATYFVQERGALGSTLYHTDDGMWLACSRWPSKTIRDASWPPKEGELSSQFPHLIKEAIEDLKSCFDVDRYPEIHMTVIAEVLPSSKSTHN